MKAVATTIYPIADPVTRTEAMNSPQRDDWIEEKAEMLAIHSTRTYTLVPRPKGVRAIKSIDSSTR